MAPPNTDPFGWDEDDADGAGPTGYPPGPMPGRRGMGRDAIVIMIVLLAVVAVVCLCVGVLWTAVAAGFLPIVPEP